MAHFLAYNTSDANTGSKPIKKAVEVTLGPLQSDFAQAIIGGVWAEQAGTLKVQQSFDWNAAEETGHWDIEESITVEAKKGKSFSVALVAPVVRLVYVNGGVDQGSEGMRLFARTFTTGR